MECEWGDTNDSWIWSVDETQCDEKDADTMIWDVYESEYDGKDADSWIWEVNESQYGGGSGDNTNEESFYTISEVRQVKSKKFRTTAVDYSVNFNNLKDLDLIREYERTQRIFQQLLNDVTNGMAEGDLVRFVLRSEQLDKPISLPFMPTSRLTPERVFSQIERVVQSHQEFRLDESVIVDIVHVEMPQGSGKRKRDTIDLESYLESKRSIIRIRNKDNLCLARALVVAIANVDKDKRYKLLTDHRRPAQEKAARELHQKAGVPFGSCGISEVKQFQKCLPEYEINIVSMEHGDTIIYPEHPIDVGMKRIYLYLHNNHYDVITTMPGFFNRSYFCHGCRKSYNSTADHLCKTMCKMCRAFECPFVEPRDCTDCGRMFKSQACYDRHKEPLGKGRSVCQQVKRCTECGDSVVVRNMPHHICGKTKCGTCKELIANKDTHLCYMKKTQGERGEM